MRTAYAAKTTAHDSAISAHRGWTSIGVPRNSLHCWSSFAPTYQRMTAVTTSCAASQTLFRRARDGGAVDVGVASGNRLGGKGGERVKTSGGAE